jgi:TRAP-type C4-dicarboxylate transport system permease small subunit
MLDRIEDLFVAGGLSVMCLVLAIQVFCRYVLNYPLIWSEEMARYLFVWVTFVGASYGIRRGSHITMEALVDRMPVSVQNALGIALNVVAFCAFAYLVPVGLLFTLDQVAIASSAMQISMALVVSAVPVGSVLICVRLVVDTVHKITAGGKAS